MQHRTSSGTIPAVRFLRSGGEVRRALLSNPRLRRDLITRVLKAMPGAELRLVPKQTSYPAAVRDAARKLLSRS